MRTLIVAAALAGLASSNGIAAVDLSLNFSSLPSAQGWTYSSSGAPETAVFSLGPGAVLRQDTLGIGSGRGANYQIHNLLASDVNITLSFSARLVAEEGVPTDYGALSVGLGLGSFAYGIALRPGEIRDIENNLLSAAFDTSVFHTYLLSIQPGVGYSVSVDGDSIGFVLPANQSIANYIYFGDGSNLNALGEYSALTVSQVPEPESLLLIVCGLAAITARLISRTRRPACADA